MKNTQPGNFKNELGKKIKCSRAYLINPQYQKKNIYLIKTATIISICAKNYSKYSFNDCNRNKASVQSVRHDAFGIVMMFCSFSMIEQSYFYGRREASLWGEVIGSPSSLLNLLVPPFPLNVFYMAPLARGWLF